MEWTLPWTGQKRWEPDKRSGPGEAGTVVSDLPIVAPQWQSERGASRRFSPPVNCPFWVCACAGGCPVAPPCLDHLLPTSHFSPPPPLHTSPLLLTIPHPIPPSLPSHRQSLQSRRLTVVW